MQSDSFVFETMERIKVAAARNLAKDGFLMPTIFLISDGIVDAVIGAPNYSPEEVILMANEQRRQSDSDSIIVVLDENTEQLGRAAFLAYWDVRGTISAIASPISTSNQLGEWRAIRADDDLVN